MKLPNWFKVVWWIVVLIGFTVLLATRFRDFEAGRPTVVDVPLALVWTALLVLPLFQEVTLFGVSFRKEIQALKEDVKDEVSSLRAEIRNSIDVRTQFSPQIFFPPSPPDSRLPQIEKRIQTAVDDALKVQGSARSIPYARELAAPSDAELLFRARYNIERELRRIWGRYAPDSAQNRRFMPTLRMARVLAEWEIIDRRIEGAIREVWSVASPAIHGETVTTAQVSFVREVAPGLVAALEAVQ